MANNKLILRSTSSPYGDILKGKTLSIADLDNNQIYLKGLSINGGSISGATLSLNTLNGSEISIDVSSLTGNFANTNLTLGDNRTHTMDDKTFAWVNSSNLYSLDLRAVGTGEILVIDDGTNLGQFSRRSIGYAYNLTGASGNTNNYATANDGIILSNTPLGSHPSIGKSAELKLNDGIFNMTGDLTYNGGIIYETGEDGNNPNIGFGTGNGLFGQIGVEYIPGDGINFWTPSGSSSGLKNNIAFVHESGYFKQFANTNPISVSNLSEDEFAFHMDGNALAGKYKDNLGVVADIEFGTPTDVLGIADTSGVYTYYSDYSSAMAAAVLGDTIEQFGNIIETGSVTITLKDRVRINMNGYKYQHINDDNIATFLASTAITTKISNGTIIRNRTTAGSGIPLLQSSNADSVFDLTGVKLIVENARAFWSQGTIIGCTVEAGGTLSAPSFFYGSLYGVTIISNDYQSSIIVGGSGTVTNGCTFISKGLNGHWQQWTSGSGGKIINCYFESNSTNQTLTTVANTEYSYCKVVQLGSGGGITTSATGIVFNHCSSKAVSGRAYSGGGYAVFNNCVGYSESGQVAGTGGGSIWNNCSLTTNSGSEVVHTFTGDNGFYNCVLTNNGTDSTSYAITSRNSDNISNYIVGCTLITASATSPILNIGGTNVNHFVYLADNKFKGGTGYTLPVTGNSVSPNNVDVYGNIQLN